MVPKEQGTPSFPDMKVLESKSLCLLTERIFPDKGALLFPHSKDSHSHTNPLYRGERRLSGGWGHFRDPPTLEAPITV